ncbi:hypothetical protein K435DRAFT_807574 [Dendrothele bispora CBS 962.96]|uniref:Uncharacterized protein n=1 Tax=Dendrothele bispora (strain CBS 962.96) TaxID=1314807 RepID=A0A4S8L4R1_DENBC|nr:hypothetical protein K435DRAFT_807574 [Dendrothele bispora CBS 962.96]
MASLPHTPPTKPKMKKKKKNNTKKLDIMLYEARCAGYPITFEVALEWANRILTARQSKRLLTTEPRDGGNILLTLDAVVKAAGGVSCNFYGPLAPGGCWEHYLIVTSEEYGRFYKVNGRRLPGSDLVDPKGEEIGKELLDQEVQVPTERTTDHGSEENLPTKKSRQGNVPALDNFLTLGSIHIVIVGIFYLTFTPLIFRVGLLVH